MTRLTPEAAESWAPVLYFRIFLHTIVTVILFAFVVNGKCPELWRPAGLNRSRAVSLVLCVYFSWSPATFDGPEESACKLQT